MSLIRTATTDDLDAVMRVRNQCIDAMRAAGIDQWDDIYPNRQTFEADVDEHSMYVSLSPEGRMTGVIVLNECQNLEYAAVPWSFQSPRILVVHRLMIDPACQGSGVARTLMTFAEECARTHEYEVIRLDAFTQNPRALRLYEGLGYRDAGGIRLRKGLFRCFEKCVNDEAPEAGPMRLVRPSHAELPRYIAALERGWSPDSVRGDAARVEQLARIAEDPDRFLAGMIDREARGAPVTLPDGSQVPRLPGYQRWMWDGDFCGEIGFRWQPGSEALPPYCLGHIGYDVVAWKRRRGYATNALREILRAAPSEGLRYVEIMTAPDNVASQRVIEKCGGSFVEEFVTPAAVGGHREWRYRVELPGR
jgi:predicted acetyltransferase/predicted GNAT family acetyltransferase